MVIKKISTFAIKKRINYDISSTFHRIPSDRHLRIRRWLLHDFPDSRTGSDAVSLDDDARVYRCGSHLTDDTGTYRYQHRHLLWLYCCPQCRHERHDGSTRKCRGNLCPGSPLFDFDDSDQQNAV